MKDTLCLDARLFRICATDVPFYAIIDPDDGKTSSLSIELGTLGLGPTNSTHGPPFIRALVEQGMVDEQIIVINMRLTNRNWRSTLTFGGIPPELNDDVRGRWFHESYKNGGPKLTKIRYDNSDIGDKNTIYKYTTLKFSTTETTCLRFGL